MSRPQPRRLALAALGLTVVLGACGGSSGSGSTATTAGASDGEGTGTPLEQLFSTTSASQGVVEDAIAACMRDRGWQYTPNRSSFGGVVSFGGDGDPTFREQYGYGISTQPPPEAFGFPTGQDQPKDPNAAYLESLSTDDQARFNKDLFGSLSEVSADGDQGAVVAATPVEMDPNSCMAKAQAEAAKTHPELSQEFGKRLGELMQAQDSDPRMQDAMTKWSACMAKANFTYAKVDEVFEDLSARAGELLGTSGPGGGLTPTGASGGGLVISSGGGVAPGASPSTTLSASDQAALAKLQDEERAIAKADAACREDTLTDVRATLEQEVVDKLRSEFPGVGSGK